MWFVMARITVRDPKFGMIPESAFWLEDEHSLHPNTGTPYRTREEAEARAFYVAALLRLVGYVAAYDLKTLMDYFYRDAEVARAHTLLQETPLSQKS